MSSPGSATTWITALRSGNAEAAEQLWQRYFERLVTLARRRLRGLRSAAADAEDVALSAFGSFFEGIRRGRFPRLRDRDNLWRLLFVITVRKALDLREHEGRLKRGGGQCILTEAELFDGTGSCDGGIEQLIGPEPTPDFEALMTEECERLLNLLPDANQLRTVAVLKMEGYTNEEIAAKLDLATRSVERKLERIRSIWSKERDT